jgi:hypothetical protein
MLSQLDLFDHLLDSAWGVVLSVMSQAMTQIFKVHQWKISGHARCVNSS